MLSFSFKNILLGMMVILLLGACGTIDKYFGDDQDKSPEQLMQEGMSDMESGNYERAFKKIT